MSGQSFSTTSPTAWPRFFLAGALALSACVSDVENGSPAQGVVARFNPAASPAVVPSPTDLIRVGGKLVIPADPAEKTNGALKAFNDYLRSLDGFPPDSSAATTFSAAVDQASLPDGVLVYDVTAGTLVYGPGKTAAPATTISPTLIAGTAAGPVTLAIKNAARWKVGHQYVVAVLSWSDATGVHGVRSPDGKAILADQAFTFLRSARPLVGRCHEITSPDCVCTDITGAGCKAIVDGVSDAQAAQLEVGRAALADGLTAALTAQGGGRKRADVAVAWSFTISSRPFAVFDSARGAIPFPSELLLKDPTAASTTVNLPASPGETPLQTQLRMGLNTLDGFSTTASVTFPIDSAPTAQGLTAIDAATVTKASARLINITPATAAEQPSYTPKPLLALLNGSTQSSFAGQVILTPETALIGDGNKYAAVLTSDVKDQAGLALTPSPATLLATQGAPLLVNGASAVPVLSSADAAQLEAVRQQLYPLVTALGLKSGQVAAVTAFRTQSITAGPTGLGQLALANYNPLAPTPTGVTIDSVATGAALAGYPGGLENVAAVVHGTMSARQLVGDLSYFAPPGKVVQIPFVLAIPKASFLGGNPAKVAIVQHGITLWRAYSLLFANALAKSGVATIGIDVNYHGSRAVCTTANDCDTGGTCQIAAGAASGKCSGKFKLETSSPLGMPGSTESQPAASIPNAYFTNFANLFAIRDNFRQHALDLTQVVRVLRDQTSSDSLKARLAALTPAVPALDPTQIGYIGQSLGSMLGTNFLAVDPFVNVAALSVGGGRIVDLYIDPASAFSANLGGVLAGLGVQAGTPQFYQLLDTMRWILDPGDPINLARSVRRFPLTSGITMVQNQKKRVLLQEAGKDTVIPNEWTRRLGIQFGLPLDAQGHLLGIDGETGATPTNVSAYWTAAGHGDAYTPVSAGGAVQAQLINYVVTGLSGPPQVTPAN